MVPFITWDVCKENLTLTRILYVVVLLVFAEKGRMSSTVVGVVSLKKKGMLQFLKTEK